jgi:transcriptional regulator with XRE-family HTH domain
MMFIWFYMKKHNLTTEDLARRIGITRAYLSNIINHRRRPSRRLAFLIQVVTNDEIMAQDLINMVLIPYEQPKNEEKNL